MKRRMFLMGSAAVATAAGMKLLAGSSQAAEAFAVTLPDAEWRKRLTPDQYLVLRQSATERTFSSPLLHEERRGEFACAGCEFALFSSATKFDSRTGWPSFWRPWRKPWGPRETPQFGGSEPPSIAAAAAGIWAMSSMTGPGRPACATAWTALR